jgi:AsmA protein
VIPLDQHLSADFMADQARNSVGRIHGRVDLRGQGNSVGRMLGTADGALQLAVDPGRISRLLMEEMGLHLLEILQLKLTGDQAVALHCAVADFAVKDGVMTARHLALDTAVSSVAGSGQINLRQETLDLTLVPRTRATSLVALRGPIRLHGPLGAPKLQLDTPGILARGASAIALGLVNPLLALVPLVEAGKNAPSPCAKAVADAGLNAPAGAAAAASAPAPRAAPSALRNGTHAGTGPPAPPPSRP